MVTPIGVVSVMYIDTVLSVTGWQDSALHWISSFNFDHHGVPIDACVALDKAAITPNNAPDQPHPRPKNSKYQFDLSKFNGPDAKYELIRYINVLCPGCYLFLHKNDTVKHQYQLRCNHYPLIHKSIYKFSDP